MKVLDMFRLDGKVAMVTGGAGKYGYQVIEALCEAGATVYMASRNRENNIAKLGGLIEQGYDLHIKEFDLSDEESILKLCDEVYAEAGKVDILVNNAVLRCMSSWQDDAKKFTQSMIANATGMFIVTRAFGDRMARDGGGSIINIGSYMGILGPDYSLYEGTDMMGPDGFPSDYFFHKGGISQHSRFLASHYGSKNVRSNCIELGGLFANQNPLFVERYSKKTCLGRMANMTDLKGLIVYLASDASAYMTGASIPLDGGYSIK